MQKHMSKFKYILLIITLTAMLTSVSYSAMKINGWFSDWTKVRKLYYDKRGDINKDRSGMDFENIAMRKEKGYLYIFIKGKSYTAGKLDNGVSLIDTSFRFNFVSISNPLKRLRVATDPKEPGVITISHPSAKTRSYGSLKKPFWKVGKLYGGKHGIELKIPIHKSKSFYYVGTYGGPVIDLTYKSKKRRKLCNVSITNVNTKTHVFIDKAEFRLYDTSL